MYLLSLAPVLDVDAAHALVQVLLEKAERQPELRIASGFTDHAVEGQVFEHTVLAGGGGPMAFSARRTVATWARVARSAAKATMRLGQLLRGGQAAARAQGTGVDLAAHQHRQLVGQAAGHQLVGACIGLPGRHRRGGQA